MSDLWQIRLTEYHGATVANVYRPYRTWRGRLRYRRLTVFTRTSGSNHREWAIASALERVPAGEEYEVIDL